MRKACWRLTPASHLPDGAGAPAKSQEGVRTRSSSAFSEAGEGQDPPANIHLSWINKMGQEESPRWGALTTLQVLDSTLRNTTQAPQVQIPTRTAGLESLILSRRRKRFLIMQEFGRHLYVYYAIGSHMLLNTCKLPFPPLGEGSWGRKQQCLQEKH